MPTLETCKGPGCINRGRRRTGLCDAHAAQQRKGRPLTQLISRTLDVKRRDEQGRKCCVSCGGWKPEADFWANGSTSDGLLASCTHCTRLGRHGITPATYDDLLAKQGGVCAGCGVVPDVFEVDHDHSCCPGQTGCSQCVRGLLCHGCNTALGRVKDSQKTLLGLVAYLGGTM